jgi:hypothetical protein
MFKSVISLILAGFDSFRAVFNQTAVPEKLSDEALLEITQNETRAYFLDFAHPDSGLAREEATGRMLKMVSLTHYSLLTTR